MLYWNNLTYLVNIFVLLQYQMWNVPCKPDHWLVMLDRLQFSCQSEWLLMTGFTTIQTKNNDINHTWVWWIYFIRILGDCLSKYCEQTTGVKWARVWMCSRILKWHPSGPCWLPCRPPWRSLIPPLWYIWGWTLRFSILGLCNFAFGHQIPKNMIAPLIYLHPWYIWGEFFLLSKEGFS